MATFLAEANEQLSVLSPQGPVPSLPASPVPAGSPKNQARITVPRPGSVPSDRRAARTKRARSRSTATPQAARSAAAKKQRRRGPAKAQPSWSDAVKAVTDSSGSEDCLLDAPPASAATAEQEETAVIALAAAKFPRTALAPASLRQRLQHHMSPRSPATAGVNSVMEPEAEGRSPIPSPTDFTCRPRPRAASAAASVSVGRATTPNRAVKREQFSAKWAARGGAAVDTAMALLLLFGQ